MKNSFILRLYKSQNTIFTAKDIALLWRETNLDILKSRINYYIKTKKLTPVRRGIYAKDENYDKLELATNIYTPSYISLETILQREGMIFQYYQTIFVASYLSRELEIKNQKYAFKKIKNEILINSTGVDKKNNYFEASKERAFLDTLYLYRDYHFDNLKPLDWDMAFEILPIYGNKRMLKRANLLYKENNNA